VLMIANAHYKNIDGVIFLEIDDQKIESEIKYENLEGGHELFPHIYGIIPVNLVINVLEFKIDKDGIYML
ncbi:DUF952 domain-containing protein, partial [bacterium]|nr:DUF952 domain-containing protein [bacterium]